MKEGDRDPPPPSWWLVDFQAPVLPGGVIFFIQYAGKTNSPDKIKKSFPQHANTSQTIRAVWIVVANLKKAVKVYTSIGLRPKGALKIPYLGAICREVAVGSGSILLIQPTQAGGYAASFLKQAGEGIMGVSLAVANLSTARALLAQNIRLPFAMYRGAYGESILIPGELANGLWIEMYENR
jgi:hypothetical protein